MLKIYVIIIAIFVLSYIGYFAKRWVLPMYRFLVKSDAVSQLYTVIKVLVEDEEEFVYNGEVHEISYGKYSISFKNTNEAIKAYEKILNETLEDYEHLDKMIILADDTFRQEKEKMADILAEIRKIQWERQAK